MSEQAHYQQPDWFTRNVFNRVVAGLTRLGISVVGSRVLEVRGRSSGQWRRNPVNLLSLEGSRYLVAPRGHTQWVRNLRASHEGRLLLGRRQEPFTATEVADDDKPQILRAYLKPPSRVSHSSPAVSSGITPSRSNTNGYGHSSVGSQNPTTWTRTS